jgi:tetratricopeptide (TPR) repeat protein
LGDLSSAQAYFERRLAAANTIGNPTGIARCRYELGTLALSRAEYALAHAHLQGCRDELVQAGDPDNDAVAMAILHLAAAAHEQGEPQAMALLAEVGEFAKRTRRAWIAASVEGTQAAWELAAGRPEAAVARLESLLAFSQAQGHRWSQAGLLIDLGTAATQRGDNAQATALLGESLIIAREIQDVPTIARALMQMGQARLAGTDHAGASRDLGEALSLLQRMGARRQVAQALEVCAGVAMAVGAAEQAARLGGAAEALRDTIGAPRWPVEQASYAGWAAAARISMGDGRFNTAWAAGRQLTLDQAVVESTQV